MNLFTNRLRRKKESPLGKGTIKFFHEGKGYGFIRPENSNEDIYFNESGMHQNLRENDEVSFEVAPGKKGPQAMNIQLV